jgi:hypothetical protein
MILLRPAHQPHLHTMLLGFNRTIVTPFVHDVADARLAGSVLRVSSSTGLLLH